MYFIENWYKFVLCFLLIGIYSVGTNWFTNIKQREITEILVNQLSEDSGKTLTELNQKTNLQQYGVLLGWFNVYLLIFLFFLGDIRRMISNKIVCLFLCSIIFFASGCYRPFEPIKLEVISPNEEAFLLPYIGDTKKQTSSNNEEYLTQNLVFTKQVKIPQQWVQKGYENIGANGAWKDAAILVKVDKSPVTREWTADPASGTSNKNEAIWVMTSDQVEFSTGWTITARIASRDDAVKFLHNYPNGSLVKVCDSEVRSKLQAVFGLEVTDLPMEKLRKEATPHITNTCKQVKEFFKERGIEITNLGISGGFIYKDKSIQDMMVKVFNAEQEKSIAVAESVAQEERNKKVVFEAEGKADSLMKQKKAEAEGIKLVADAKMYELKQSSEQLPAYISLKNLELQKEMLTKWDGSYPRFFMGQANPNTILQLPSVIEK